MAAFALGDKVWLVAGGPEMAVKTVPEKDTGWYTAQWFAGKKLEEGRFPAESLTKTAPKPAKPEEPK